MTQPRDDVQRLFDRLVEVLAGRAPHLLDAPIPVADLYETLVPYRTHRTSLGFDSHQDYEMALLRLLAGEHGLADLDHDDAKRALLDQARAVNPNPGAFRAWGTARVRLNQDAADAVLLKREAFAPPVEAPAEPEPPAALPVPGRQLPFEFEQTRAAAATPNEPSPSCPHCDQALPGGRMVVYCPFCGGNVTTRACPECGTALETAWRHCITCGYKVG